MKTKRVSVQELIEIYKHYSAEAIEEEIDALLELSYALLEVTESDAIESWPNPNVRIKISCEVTKDANGKYYI